MALVKKQRDSRIRRPPVANIKMKPAIEKRQQPRFTSQFRSTFSGGQREGQGWTLDLSTGGCKIESNWPVVVGTAFEFRIYVPGLDWPLRIDEAQVRWAKGGTFGVQFTKIQSDEEGKLKQVIASLNEELNR